MTPNAAVRIVQVGFASTVQDHGRPGFAHLGVPTAGAVDRRSHDLVNRLVGNGSGAATIETMGALVIQALRPIVVATSADGSRHTLATGALLRVDAPADAVWAYLAVRGGIDVSPVLGSRSLDTLGGVGPPALTVGSILPVGSDPGTDLVVDLAPPRRPGGEHLRVWDGPQVDWFAGAARCLTERPWRVTNELSRVGVRLEAGDFPRSALWQPRMASVGLTVGAVQITPAGDPIVMLANHPTTGGYPVIAVVDPDELALLAQIRPGGSVRFRSA